MRIRMLATIVAASLATAAGTSLADGDAAKGEKVFAKCKTCHEVASDRNKVGPTLQGVIGRKAGTVPNFKYSEAMVASGITWDEATIAEYVAKPKEFVPGNKMAFAGLKKEDEIENLIAYLKEACCS